ncbi:MAG: proline racemase family protein, partial [Lachnospiraceae bacterium]|nr:proline racemase family protein [Lachnospiraceae bacterium]
FGELLDVLKEYRVHGQMCLRDRVDTTKLDIGEINPKTVPEYTKLGMKMLDAINKEIPIQHPLLDITSVDLVEFYGPTPNPEKATMRNVVIFGDAMADRSPCGTGTSAKLATLHHWGEIKVGEEFIYESFIGSLFKGVIKETAKVGDFDAVIPMITGSCYLTGVATYLIDPQDPLKYGFQVG